MQPVPAFLFGTICFAVQMFVAGGAFAAQTSTATPAAPISKGTVPALVSLAKDLEPVAPDRI